MSKIQDEFSSAFANVLLSSTHSPRRLSAVYLENSL